MNFLVLRQGTPGSPEITFLHGMLGVPDSLLELAPHLPSDWKLSGVVLPGHGPSPSMPPGDFTALASSIAAELPQSPWRILLGYSLGARLALTLAMHHPRSTRGVIALGAHLGIEDEEERLARLSSDQENARDVLREGLPRFVDRWEKLPLFATQATVLRASLDRQRRARLSHTEAGIAWAFDHLSTARMHPVDLAAREVPVVLAAGARDTKFRNLAETSVKRFSGVELGLIEGAGHNAILEAPAAVATIVRARLERWTGDST